MVSVKICGLTNESDLESAVRAGASRVGFVIVPASPRYVEPRRVRELAANVYNMKYDPERWADVWIVATFSLSGSLSGAPHTEALDGLLVGLPEAAAVQLHGKETPDDLAYLKKRFPRIAIVKAIGVSSAEDLDQLKAFDAADMFLLDAKPPEGADREGGHGKPFDWSILEGFDPGRPWVLSGGLTRANVAEAIRVSGAKAVDVSSGVEARPGVKDPAKVKAFIEAAKAAG
jgi:phosphoribosylanthranilate isomerase